VLKSPQTNQATQSVSQDGRSIVYFTQNPLSDRDIERFGIEYYLNCGFKVTVFDISRIIFSMYRKSSHKDFHYTHQNFLLHTLYKKRDIFSHLEALKKSSLVIFFAEGQGPHFQNLFALRLFKRLNCRYLIATINGAPAKLRKTAGSSKLEESGHKRLSAIRLPSLNGVIKRLPLWLLGISPADFIIYDGRKSIRPNPLAASKTQPILAHSFDYEKALSIGTHDVALSDTAVFLDQYVPYHPDMVATGFANAINVSAYYASLRKLFDQIEKELGFNVIVSAHPRSNYPEKAEEFGGRKIVRNQTPKLVRGCRLVIGHCSTSLNYAVLWNKPIMIVSTRDYYSCDPTMAEMINGYALSLDKPVRWIAPDEDADLSDALEVNVQPYKAFKEDYIKMEKSVDLPFWQIVSEQALKMKQRNIN
jgi:hypothetical protein